MKKFYLSIIMVLCCVQVAVSDVLNEGFEAGVLPAGWTQEYVRTPITLDVDTAVFSWTVEKTVEGDTLLNPFGAAEGLARIAARNNTPDEMRFVTRLITPAMNLTAAGLFRPQVVFSHAEPDFRGYSDTLRVYYRTSANDAWHAMPKCVYTRNRQWQQEVIELPQPSTTYQLAFEITESMGRGVVLDNIIVRSTPTCRDVTDVTGIAVHAFDATVAWNEEGYFDHFDVLVTSAPVADMTNIDSSIVVLRNEEVFNTEILLTDLTPETTYYVYVRSDCDENASGFTEWAAGSFKTLAVAYLPYSQNFQTQMEPLANSVYFGKPHGWTTGAMPNKVAPFVYKNSKTECAPYSVDSTAFLSFNGEQKLVSSPIAANDFAYAATPEVVTTNMASLEIGFWATAYDKISAGVNKYASALIVGVMTNPADFATFDPVDTVYVESGFQFKHFTVSLRDYAGEGKYVALASHFSDRNAMYVDNFTMEEAAAFVPSHLRVSNTSTTGFTVHVDTNGADSWNLMVATDYARNGAVAPASILYSATGLTANEVNVLKADSSLAGQIVRIYAQAVKGGVTSDWCFPVTLRVPTHMSVPYINECNSGTDAFIQLNMLNSELRGVADAQKAMASVFFPLTAITADVKCHPTLESTAPNYDAAHARLEGTDSYFVLPEVDEISTLKMIFRFATATGASGKMDVGVMTDPYDLSTFERLASFNTTVAEYRRGLVSFDSYTGEGKYIAFRLTNANVAGKGSVMLLDKIQVEPLGICREPSNVSAKVSSTEAVVTWNGGNMDGWIVGLSNVRQMLNVKLDTVYEPTYTFSNLETEKTYYYTIQAICDGEPMDLDNVYYEFTTPRGLPFEENFLSSNLPTGWTRKSGSLTSLFNGAALTTTTGGWSISSTSTYRFAPQAGYFAYMEIWSTNQYMLFSPVLALPEEAENLKLTFDLGVHGWSGSSQAGPDDIFGVVVSTDGGNSWSRANATLWTNDGTGEYVLNDLDWEAATSVEIDFSQYAGMSVQFGFVGISTVGGNGDNYFSIDNISLHIEDNRCGGITNLRAVSNDASNTQIAWNLLGIDPYPALVQVAESESFANCVFSDTLTTTSITLNNLASSTRYYVRARQLCPAGSEWVTMSFATACEPFTLEAFGVQDFSNAGALDCWTTGFFYENGTGTAPARVNADGFGPVLRITKSGAGDGYSDGAYAMTPTLDTPEALNAYQIVFRAATYSDDATNVGRIAVGIVTNPDDPSSTYSEIASLRLAHATDSVKMKTYVVSFENYRGDLFGRKGHNVMFVSEVGADSTNYVYIDNVMLEPAQACHMVLNLDCDTTTEESATLVWDGDDTQYELMLTETFANPDTVTNPLFLQEVTGHEYTVENLFANTTYYAYIRTICDEGETSRWSSATSFRTRYGIFFEPWDDKAGVTGAGWKHGIYRMTTNAPFPGSALTTDGGWSLQTATASTPGMYDKFVRSNVYGDGTSSTNTTGHRWLITPSIDLTDLTTGAMLSFNMSVYAFTSGNAGASASTDKALYVLVSEDDGATWNPATATSWRCDGKGDYDFRQFSEVAKKCQVDLSDYVGKTIKVGFYGQSLGTSSDLYYGIDSIGVAKYIAQCLGVRNLAVELISDSEAKATWRNISIPDEVKLELATDADFTNIVAEQTVTEVAECTFTDLLPNLIYYVRATQLCEGATPVVTSFATPKAIPYEEPFSGSAVPAGWEQYQGNVQAAFEGTLPQPSTNASWKVNNDLVGFINKQAANNEYWIVSPDIVLNDESTDDIYLFFDLALTMHNSASAPTAATATDNMEFRVLVSTDNGASWSEEHSWLFSNTSDAVMRLSDLGAEAQRISLELSDFRGERVRIAFYKGIDAASNNAADIHVSNFQIRVVGDECATPTNLVASQVSFTSAHLSWESEAESAVLIQYATMADFSNAKSDTIVSGTEHDLVNLATATTYFVRVRNLCGSNSVSEYSDVVTFATSIGLPYTDALAGRGTWTAYTTTGGAPAAEPAFTASTALAGWRTSTAKILGGDHIGCAHNTSTFWFVSPEIDLTPNITEEVIALTFDLAVTSGMTAVTAATAANLAGKRFYVMFSTDNGETWPAEYRVKWSDDADANYSFTGIPNTGDTYQIDITRFGGQHLRVALVLEGSTKKSFAVHAANFSIDALASRCFGVSNIVVNHVDTAAQITITPNDAAQQWQLAYGKTGTDLLAMPTVIANSLTANLGGLELNSTYDVYARSICAAGDTSAWFGPISFDTPLGITYTAPLRNAFNDWTLYTGAESAVFADATALTAATKGWTASSSIASLGEPHVYASKDNTVTNWLISPVINLMPQAGTTTPVYLSLDLALTGSATSTAAPTITAGNTFRIAISQDGGATWSEASSILFGDESANEQYASIPAGKGRSYHFDVTRFVAGHEVRIALIHAAASNNSVATIHVNDIELAEYAVPCFGLEGFTAVYDNGVAQCTILPGASDTGWQYAFGARGFVPTSADAVTVDSTSFNVAVPMSSDLDFYARALCGAQDTSAWYGPVRVKTPYGVRYADALTYSSFNSEWSEYSTTTGTSFTEVTSHTWGMGSTKNSYAFGTNHAYINAYQSRKYILATPEIDLASANGQTTVLTFDLALTGYNSTTAPISVNGQSFEVRVSLDGGATWDNIAAVWSDEDTHAEYPYSGIPAAGENYTVDLTDYVGEKIKVGFYSISTGGGCDNDIHVRNVVVDTLSGSVCAAVRRMSVLSNTYTSMTVAFRGAGVDKADSLQYICLPHNSFFNANLAQNSDTNVVTITGLQASMEYDLYARTKCDDGWTAWAGPFVAATKECTPITGIASSNITLTTAEISLRTEDAEAALGYQLFITENGGVLDELQAISSTTNLFSFAYEFTPSTAYDVYARKLCVEGEYSDWTGPFKVKSPIGAIADQVLNEPLDGGSLPTGWTKYYASSTAVVPVADNAFTTSTSGWSFGTHNIWDQPHAYINIYSSNKYMLATPVIDLASTGKAGAVLMFDLALTAYLSDDAATAANLANERFEIRVSTDAGATWQLVESWDQEGGDYDYLDIPVEGETYEVNLSEYANEQIMVGFFSCAHNATYTGADLHLRNIIVASAGDEQQSGPVCGTVALAVENAGLAQAVINVTYNDEKYNNKCYYELATDRDFDNVISADTVYGAQFTVTGLTAMTTYYVRAKNFCWDDAESRYSGILSFTTSRGLPFFEDFNESTSMPTDWTRGSALASTVFTGNGKVPTATSGWSVNSSSGQMQSNHLYNNIYGTTKQDWVITPALDLTPNAGEQISMSFDMAKEVYGSTYTAEAYDDQFMVVVSIDGGQTWRRDNAFIWNNLTTPDARRQGGYDVIGSKQHVMLDLTPYGGQVVKVAFYGESTIANGDNKFRVDDVLICVTRTYDYTDTICSATEYTEHGFNYPAYSLTPGLHNLQRVSALNDSIVNLALYVRESYRIEISDTICEGDTYTQYGYNLRPTMSDTYTRRLEGVNGCDSTVVLHLTVNPIQRTIEERYACLGSSYTILGQTFYGNAVISDTVPSVTGCDSIITYYINFSDQSEYHTVQSIALCAGDTYQVNDSLSLNLPGVYKYYFTTRGGCDSTAIIKLLEIDAMDNVRDTIYENEIPYMYNGRALLKKLTEGVYDYSFNVLTSCGGNAKLYLHVLEGTGLNDQNATQRRIRKFVLDGHIYIMVDDILYDATGRRLE